MSPSASVVRSGSFARDDGAFGDDVSGGGGADGATGAESDGAGSSEMSQRSSSTGTGGRSLGIFGFAIPNGVSEIRLFVVDGSRTPQLGQLAPA